MRYRYRFLVIDGSYLARSKYEAGSGGRGFVRKLEQLRNDYNPLITAVAWDTQGSSAKRKEISPEYKAKRKKWAPDYVTLVETLQEGLPYIDVVQYYARGWEGDDIMNTVAKGPGPVLLWTADKDMFQCVAPGVDMLRYVKKEDTLYTYKTMKEQTGLTPWGWSQMLTLAGDPIDGIPGLTRVGKTRARAIIDACPNFVGWVLAGEYKKARAEILAKDDTLTKYVEQAIREKDLLNQSWDLVKLRTVNAEVIEPRPDIDKAHEWRSRL